MLLASRGASIHVAGGSEQGVDAVAVAALGMVTAAYGLPITGSMNDYRMSASGTVCDMPTGPDKVH
jgi:hypothetical protein